MGSKPSREGSTEEYMDCAWTADAIGTDFAIYGGASTIMEGYVRCLERNNLKKSGAGFEKGMEKAYELDDAYYE